MIQPPFTPCGRIVDYVRSCYRTFMRFDPNSDTLTPIQWVFALPNAKPLGVPTIFGSANWAWTRDIPWSGLGEQRTIARPWFRGESRHPTSGRFLCVPPSAFTDSVPDPSQREKLDGFGTPVCCFAPHGITIVVGGRPRTRKPGTELAATGGGLAGGTAYGARPFVSSGGGAGNGSGQAGAAFGSGFPGASANWSAGIYF